MKIVNTVLLLLSIQFVFGQGTVADYKRAKELKTNLINKIENLPGQFYWSEKGDVFWYNRFNLAEREYILVLPKQKQKEILFDPKTVFTLMENQLERKLTSQFITNDRIKLLDEQFVSLDFEGYLWTWDRKNKELKRGAISERKDSYGGYWGKYYADDEYREVESPDKKHVAFIRNSNVFVAPTGNLKNARQVTFDGNLQAFYSSNLKWSSDSKKIATVKNQKLNVRQLTLLESSPREQLQPKLQTRDYVKPGDAIPQKIPVIYNLESNQLFVVDQAMIANQFSISDISWRNDGRAITFEYNKRGHQEYAVVELDAQTGSSRLCIQEKSNTFIDYSGKKYRKDIQDGNEIIWASERDGWNHLYLYDGKTGKVKNQITKGNWVVRKVVYVDEVNRKLIFEGSGRNKDQDPYFIQYYTVDFDGKNLKELTKDNGNHQATWNKDYTQFIDVYSRVDQAPVAVLRDGQGNVLMDLESANIKALDALGWRAPEVFTAKGRDGVTDIWGMIVRPTNFDPNKLYPVIEYIYAGPHSSFVPKSFYANPSGMYELAELGFIVVQIDGMGTSNRSKAFHDVCWKNLKDAGFPDRILWMQAAAKQHKSMDMSKVGIYGTSAGGQSSTGALLFHPEFYKVGVSSCGCHDNRMDKIWWNEQWMGWPVGPEYAASSNVEHAANLKGNLMLIVGELDDNVDPASTYQLVNALIKANKDHEFIMVPGMGHSSGDEFGERKRRDYFVKHLLGIDPPAWNAY